MKTFGAAKRFFLLPSYSKELCFPFTVTHDPALAALADRCIQLGG